MGSLPGDVPPSEDEKRGSDNGPCSAFRPSEPPWERTCARCGYGDSSHR